MHLFHKWGKWSEPEKVTMKFINHETGMVNEYIDWRQERRCEKCGLVEFRMVKKRDS